uniref:Uncharacterized protein n=1 Tax=Chromera velia CCMP2878 TaxID=1169474 RepID=A0A0K6S648_9ALVE|eukprot:Cvel_16015.t1-p1 / transcript=Cvel_16015.t1 / gene=Cvel_16015 / organism=Chromera_velia_CCMP2878 / gene_product=hypothetical protein / transcript_product=hypothetical protein / location=Cvel_scaffold1215:25310-27852(-) / protein_length=212 / sequence_SO=supercontig / SO=protein_coding / is_pseudo=false
MDPSQPSGGTEDAVPAEARMARRKSSRNHTLHVPAASPAAAVAAANGGLLNPLPPDAFSLPKRGSIFDTFDDTKSSKETELEKSVKNLREELHASQAFAQSSKARAEALNEQLQKTNENYLKEITRLREEKERSRQVIVELRRDLNMLTTRLGENVLKGFKAEPKKALMSLLSSPEGMKAFKAAIKRWEMMVLETLKNHDADADEDLLAERP